MDFDTEVKVRITKEDYKIIHEAFLILKKLSGRYRKVQNAHATIKKVIANGSHIGRPKKANDQLIWELRDKGLSMRAIAKEVNASTTTVQNSLHRKRGYDLK